MRPVFGRQDRLLLGAAFQPAAPQWPLCFYGPGAAAGIRSAAWPCIVDQRNLNPVLNPGGD